MLPSSQVKPPKADFCIEIDYEKGSPNPSRVFRAMSDLIEALQSLDTTLAEPLTVKLEPILLLEDIEAGSIKTWLAQKLETLDDDALASGDYKKVVGTYLVKGKRATVNFLRGTTSITSAADIEPLERQLFELGEDAYESRLIPTYRPVSRQRLLNDINKINTALQPLTGTDRVNPAKVVVSEIDRQHRLEVFPLLAESISQSRQSADRCLCLNRQRRINYWEYGRAETIAQTKKWKRPGPPTSLAFSFTALGAVFIGRRRSASSPMCPHPTAATP